MLQRVEIANRDWKHLSPHQSRRDSVGTKTPSASSNSFGWSLGQIEQHVACTKWVVKHISHTIFVLSVRSIYRTKYATKRRHILYARVARNTIESDVWCCWAFEPPCARAQMFSVVCRVRGLFGPANAWTRARTTHVLWWVSFCLDFVWRDFRGWLCVCCVVCRFSLDCLCYKWVFREPRETRSFVSVLALRI